MLNKDSNIKVLIRWHTDDVQPVSNKRSLRHVGLRLVNGEA